MTLNTMIAELEEAERAATPLPWIVSSQNKKCVEGGAPFDHNGWRRLVSDSFNGADDGAEEANARLIALMRTHLPALIEAVKRQGEALAEIARHDNTGITGPGRQQADSCVQSARAALKEATGD